MLKQKHLISYLCIFACWVFLTIFLTTPTFAAGEKYAWEDKNKDSLLVSGGDYSVGFSISKVSGNKFADSGGVARDKVSGCLVLVTLDANAEGTRARVSVSLDPTSALGDSNCDVSKASDISKRFTPDITIDQTNVGRDSINNRSLKVQSVVEGGEFPSDSDTITIKDSKDKEVVKKKTTTKIENGFEITFPNIGLGQYTACSSALKLCEEFRQDSSSSVLVTKTVIISKDLSETSCAVDGIGWVVCPVLTFLGKLNDVAYGFLNNFLEVPARLFNDQATKAAWDTFKNFANVAFIIAFLVIIYSQITGAGVSNYGLKRLLPKLVIAAILVNVSFYICAILVDLSNIVGSSLFDLLKNIKATPNTVDGGGLGSDIWSTAIAFVLGAGALIGLLAVVLFAPMTLLAFALIILILIGRQAFVILLIVVSPLAFVAYLLPNTEQWFKKWWKSFTAMLMVFPIIALVFGASSLASSILMSVSEDCKASVNTEATDLCKENGQGQGDDDQLMKIIAAAVLAVPLFAVPLLLKGSLSAAGNIGSRIANIQDRANRSASGKAKERAGALKNDAASRFAIAANNSSSKWGKRLGGYTRYKNKRDNLRSLRESEAKRGAESTFAEALGDKDSSGNYTNAARKLQKQAAGGAGKTAEVRAAAMATRQQHKQFGEDTDAFKATMSTNDNANLISKISDNNLSTEERAAAAGLVMSRSHRDSHIEALKTVRKQMEDAEKSGDNNAMDEIRDIQMQMTHDMKEKPFGLGDNSIGQLGTGEYGKLVADKDGELKRAADIEDELRNRVGTKLSAQSLATMNPDEMRRIQNDALEGRLSSDQINNLVEKIKETRTNRQMDALVKPEARAMHDKILAKASQDSSFSTYVTNNNVQYGPENKTD